jgi:hypothetical protein
MFCERGIRTYEDHTRFTLPLATVPLLHNKRHLPVVVDPSHDTGKSKLLPPMARRPSPPAPAPRSSNSTTTPSTPSATDHRR